jgi:hypothetical protein
MTNGSIESGQRTGSSRKLKRCRVLCNNLTFTGSLPGGMISLNEKSDRKRIKTGQ